MKKLIRFIREDMAARSRYFREAEREIAGKNLRLLEVLSLITAVLLLFFFALTPFIVRGWTITPQHLFFLPAVLIFFLISFLYRKKGSGSSKTVTFLCLLFESTLFVFIILIDVLTSPNAPGTFMPLLCIALSALFLLPFRWNYPLIFIFEAIYIVCVCLFKTSFIGQYDIFSSIVGLAFSIAASQAIMRLRIRDYEVRRNYEQLSRQDFLPGILNKKTFQEETESYLQGSCEPAGCAFLILDIDNFKIVNDRLGHYTGDLLLGSVGMLLPEIFPASSIIGRFGGDEFMVLIKEVTNPAILKELCCRIRGELLCAGADDCPVQVTCSIGGVWTEGQTADFESLFRQADDALYQAKNSGKDSCVLLRYRKN